MGYEAGNASSLGSARYPCCGPCLCHHTSTLGSWPYGLVGSMSGPTLEKRRSRRREPGHRQLGTVAHQGKPLAVEGPSTEEMVPPIGGLRHLCDMNQSRGELRKVHLPLSTAGWIPQGGGRPRLWRFFPRFLIGEKSGPAERPLPGDKSMQGMVGRSGLRG